MPFEQKDLTSAELKAAIIEVLAEQFENSNCETSFLIDKAKEKLAKEAASRASVAEKSYKLADKILKFPADVLSAVAKSLLRSTQNISSPGYAEIDELMKEGSLLKEHIFDKKYGDQEIRYGLTETKMAEIRQQRELRDIWTSAKQAGTSPQEKGPPKAERRLPSLQSAAP